MNVNSILVKNFQKIKLGYADFSEEEYRTSYKAFSAWMHTCLKGGISNEISAMYFGITENEGKLGLYISGSIVANVRKNPQWMKEENYKRKVCPGLSVLEFFENKLSESREKAAEALKLLITSYVNAYNKAYPATDLNRKAKKKADKKQTKLRSYVGLNQENLTKIR